DFSRTEPRVSHQSERKRLSSIVLDHLQELVALPLIQSDTPTVEITVVFELHRRPDIQQPGP
ncbi:MAG: hypothetical protein ABEJ55_07830, partial [Halanaeroarchaeum sp.]